MGLAAATGAGERRGDSGAARADDLLTEESREGVGQRADHLAARAVLRVVVTTSRATQAQRPLQDPPLGVAPAVRADQPASSRQPFLSRSGVR
jgi:hypothetical protein